MSLIDHPSAVAITGMACRFPGAPTVQQFWENLRGGVESITFFTDEELVEAGIPQAALAQADYVRAKPLVSGIEQFDAAFFGLTPREASLMDPQHRLFLECAWEALESAGHDADRFRGRIGVYGGANLSSYLLFNLLNNPDAMFSLGGVGGRTGIDKDFLTTQVSYRLNLRGPSFAVQTACSTSLVALHVACQQLLDGDCDMALAGGVGINLPHKAGYLYQEGSIYSPDGHCRAFDAGSEGTLLGDGAGIVVLRRLADALADGDPIHAVVRGSAINNDGSTKVGFSAPSVDSQAEVITEAMALARVAPDTVTYVEAHGTGTKLGDPIEVAALTHAFRAGTERKGFCGLGSVKTNFGHLDAAAGVAGLIKTVLSLENRQIPASLHFQKPNPQIDFANSPFFVNAELRDWPAGPEPRRAGVSSFGVGGTNAHVVLEEAPPREPSGPSRPWQLLPLSAKTPTALDAATANLARFLADHPAVPLAPLADIAFTLQSGRRAFPHRRIVVCADTDGATGAITALQALDPVRTATSAAGAHARAVAFLFPGQGAQHVNMARDVYEGEPVFRQELDRCAEILQPHLDLDLRTVLYPAAGGEEEAGRLLEQTRLTQPALFAVEYALARLWMSWGITPQALIGHSVGEYVAACLAGVFPLEDALALVAARGRLIQGLPAGAMLAVPLPEAEVAPRLAEGGPELSLAAVNGPGFCVVSGPEEPVEALRKILNSEGVECTRLHTSHAFHSAMMDPILGPFAERVGRVRLDAPKIPYLSNVTGAWITAAEATDPGYWTRHIRQTVRFADGLAALLEDPDRVLLEVGPGQSLTTLARQMPARAGSHAGDRVAIPSLRRPKDDGPDLPRVLHALGRLWAAGVRVDWSAFAAGERRQRVALPTYPFERERFWVDPVLGRMALSSAPVEAGATPGPGLVKQDIDRWFYVPAWKQADRLAAPLSREEDAPGSWLLFLPPAEVLGHRLAERLRDRGETVVTAFPGDAFGAHEDGTFTLRPAERKDYDALFKELRARKIFPRGVPDRAVHAWNLGPGDGGTAVPFYSLLYLVQVLSEEAAGEEVRLGIVSSGLQAVTGDEEIEPEKALLLGFCRVVPQENPKLAIQSLDVTMPDPGSQAERDLAGRLLAELEGEAPHELTDRVVAFRGRHRWVQHHEPAALDGRFSQAPGLRQGGVYLLTGGLDPTTLTFARHLANLDGKLAITVPPGFPERESWDALTASPANGHDPVRRTVQAVRELEEQGAEVLLIPVDLAEAADEAVNRTLERFGTLHGVLHVEMFPGAGLIQLKTPELANPVLRPRVTATRALARALAAKVNGAGLDFFALFASTIGVTGGLGQIDFSAANNYLDAFAHQQRASGGLPAVAIDWGAFRWEEWQQMLGGGPSGMQLEMQKSIEAFGIDVPESLEAFRRVLAAGVPQVVVSTGDLDLVLRQHDVITAQLLGQQPGAGSGQHHARPMLSSQYVAPANDVETGIANIWQDLLGIAPIGVQDNFFELAGNSLTAIQIVTRVRKAFDVDVSMSAIFEAPTVGGLARIVQAGQLGDEALAEVDGILDEIENLSAEELERLLAEEMESGDAAHGG